MRRDGQLCQLGLRGCLHKASEVDHIRPGGDHSLSNLRAVCTPCHGRKSAAEGAAASVARRRELRTRRFRPAERHPGSLCH
ncbi:HNH endonuclease [Nocardia iowensis]|uniref:HNH endonuclease n=1 Tax=Nocardia iowensis TaxID=204891 RepID=A0ABX8S608_NOCIO|nr:HNH endonuclease [Nocardia iowensis]QXN95341.1 HNH endonuclease [Nocardia iowensis]